MNLSILSGILSIASRPHHSRGLRALRQSVCDPSMKPNEGIEPTSLDYKTSIIDRYTNQAWLDRCSTASYNRIDALLPGLGVPDLRSKSQLWGSNPPIPPYEGGTSPLMFS